MSDDRPSLVVILGDQLSPEMTSLAAADKGRDVVLMCEVEEETAYVGHHKQKIAFILSAMRHFAEELEEDGWTVDYIRLTDEGNTGSFTGEVERAIKRHHPDRIVVTDAGEWRVQQMIDGWAKDFDIDVDCLPDQRFICSKPEFEDWAEGRKSLRMEYFYREMRRKTGLLMAGDGKPAGGEWNFDKENRKPADNDLFLPDRRRFEPDEITKEVIDMVAETFADNFGELAKFGWAVTRKDAEKAFAHFLKAAAEDFGAYQDAMLEGKPFLWHSLISPYLNVGLLDPLDVCRQVAEAWEAKKIPLNSAEGFIRQIIGWREYMRGIYWREGPDYVERNFFEADRDLPRFYYDGETDMECLSQAIGQTLDYAYAHHIQRLMITGNFAMLAGIDPKQVHAWYLEVYADAYEWVELPNVLGMSQFGDGGLLASKPYASSGNYIDKMSDYCGACRYNVKTKTEDDSCPFNSLYWDFLARNEDKLSGNSRMALAYRNWDNKETGEKISLRAKARAVLDSLNEL